MQRNLTHAPYKLCVTYVTHHWHVRELTHARWPVVRAEEQTFFFLTLVRFSTFNLHVFNHFHMFFLTTLMLDTNQVVISTYKYPHKLPLFLTLSRPTRSPSFSSSFLLL